MVERTLMEFNYQLAKNKPVQKYAVAYIFVELISFCKKAVFS